MPRAQARPRADARHRPHVELLHGMREQLADLRRAQEQLAKRLG